MFSELILKRAQELITERRELRNEAHYVGDPTYCIRQNYYILMKQEPSNPPNFHTKFLMAELFAGKFVELGKLKTDSLIYQERLPGLKLPIRIRYHGIAEDAPVVVSIRHEFTLANIMSALNSKHWIDHNAPYLYLIPDGFKKIRFLYICVNAGQLSEITLGYNAKGQIYKRNEFYGMDKILDCDPAVYVKKYYTIERQVEQRTPPLRAFTCYFRKGEAVKEIRDKKLKYKSKTFCFFCQWRDYCWLQDNEGKDLAVI
ncbi:MAG: hypothetical protein UY18_C0018G0008 [Microgenomates group bacterium GW2011_GWF2_47_9]|nr:MAG: hypothetical protein UY18_C0018G0008 [Microgenomates group bacterium GW2011_GWF2_47_9]